MYAITRLDTWTVPFLVNTAGFFLNLSFVICFWMFCAGRQKSEFKTQFGSLAVFWLLACFIWISTGSNDVVGYFAAFVNSLMYFGPLAAAGQVVRSRSVRGMPFAPLLMTLISSLVWCGYGIYLFNVPAMIPNGLGIIFGIVQISLYCWAKGQEGKSSRTVENSFDPEIAVAEGFAPMTTSDDEAIEVVDSGTLAKMGHEAEEENTQITSPIIEVDEDSNGHGE